MRPLPSDPEPLRHRIEALAARTIFAGLHGLDVERASTFGGWMARAVGPLSGAHRTARRNLARALPALDEAQRESILESAWDNLGRTAAEYAVLPRLWPTAWRDRITVTGHEPLAALARAGKPAILFSAHLGNWEMIPLALAQLARPLTIVYRPPNNRAVNDIIGGVRASYTAAMAPKGSAGARMIMRALGADGLVFMVVDQKINEGLEIPFFGRGAFTGPAVPRMAMRFGCPVFPVRCIRRDGCRFDVRVEEPWTFSGADNDDAAVRAALVQINMRLEHWIAEHPGQWLWMHKRWPRESSG